MATITDLGATTPGDTSRTIINTNFDNLNTDKAEISYIQKDGYNYAADSGSADAYTVTLSPVPSAYAAGMRVVFKAGNTNTGASTLNVNSLGAKTIKKLITQDLAAGDISQNAIVSVVYDGTYFQLEGVVSGVVYTSGDQTIAGTKTFSSFPVTPSSAPTTNYQAANKKYVDDHLFSSKARAYLSSNQDIPKDTWTKVGLDTENYDGLGEFDNTTNYRFTATVAGYYLATGKVRLNENLTTGTLLYSALFKNTTETATEIIYSPGVYPLSVSITDILYLDVGDYIELKCYHTYSENRQLLGNSPSTFLSVHRVS